MASTSIACEARRRATHFLSAHARNRARGQEEDAAHHSRGQRLQDRDLRGTELGQVRLDRLDFTELVESETHRKGGHASGDDDDYRLLHGDIPSFVRVALPEFDFVNHLSGDVFDNALCGFAVERVPLADSLTNQVADTGHGLAQGRPA